MWNCHLFATTFFLSCINFSVFYTATIINVSSCWLANLGFNDSFVAGERRFKKFVNWIVRKLKSWKNQFDSWIYTRLIQSEKEKKTQRRKQRVDFARRQTMAWKNESLHECFSLCVGDSSHVSISQLKFLFFSQRELILSLCVSSLSGTKVPFS